MHRCRQVRALNLMVTISIFIFILLCISLNSSSRKKRDAALLLPTKPFWSSRGASGGYWNRQQQKLDYLYNPVFGAGNSSVPPDRLNHTEPWDPCSPHTDVALQVPDFNTLPQRFRDFLLHMRCRSYPLLVDEPHLCQKPPYLLLAIKSQAPHFDRRQAIRESWGRSGLLMNRSVVSVFLLGRAGPEDHHPDLRGLLRQESERHRDLLLWDFRDTFFNLTVKDVLFLDWFSRRCSHAAFVFKGDDDVFVNTYRVLSYLQSLPAHNTADLFVGDVISNAGPHRNAKLKYYIPQSVFVGPYPPYAGGGGFLYSGRLALRLQDVARRVELYPIDDVYTGMCLRKLGLGPRKHKGFRTFDIPEKYRSRPCAYSGLVLVHSRTPQQVVQIWQWISDPKLAC